MCDSVMIGWDGGQLETQGELAKALGVHVGNLPIRKEYDGTARGWKQCLCPIDLIATAERFGYVAKTNGMDVVFVSILSAEDSRP